MPDPISVISLGLGVASLAVQIFEGCEKGYGYFLSASNMSEECKVVKVRLLIEYSRLLDWGEMTGLPNRGRHDEYDRSMKMNRELVAAILGETRLRLKSLSKMSLEYGDMKWDDKDLYGENQPGSRDARPKAVDISTPVPSGPEIPHVGRALEKSAIRDVVDEFEDLFHTPNLPPEATKYHRGLNRIIRTSMGMRDIVSSPKNFKWALKDKKKIERELLRLKELNDFLHGTVSDSQTQLLVETTRETWLGMLQLTQSVAGLEQLLKAIHDDLQATNSIQANDRTLSGSTLIRSTNASMLDAQTGPSHFKTSYERLTLFTINAAQSMQTGDDTSHLLVELDDVYREKIRDAEETDQGLRKHITLEKGLAWVEWKYFYDATVIDENGKTTDEPDHVVEESVKRLVSLLQVSNRPDEFCVPSCQGYFLDEDFVDKVDGKRRFGLIYESPRLEAGHPPMSLLVRLRGKRPSIQRRIKLAHDIATCVMYLHAVNWLHKGLRSANVLLLPHENDTLGKICLAGFDYARPDNPGLTQRPLGDDNGWGEYIHPGYLGYNRVKGYRKTYDVYSLGIILLEIAYWQPAEEILEPFERTTVGLSSLRDHLLTDDPTVLQQVQDDMGEKYHAAVRTCLIGMEAFGLNEGHDQGHPAIAALIQQAFSRGVVDMLSGIVL